MCLITSSWLMNFDYSKGTCSSPLQHCPHPKNTCQCVWLPSPGYCIPEYSRGGYIVFVCSLSSIHSSIWLIILCLSYNSFPQKTHTSLVAKLEQWRTASRARWHSSCTQCLRRCHSYGRLPGWGWWTFAWGSSRWWQELPSSWEWLPH